MVVAPAVNLIPADVQIHRFRLGLPIGAIIGAIAWPISAWFKKKENEAVRQMLEEKQGNSNKQMEDIVA